MIHVQEKTKKKISKEQGLMQASIKDPIPFKSNPMPVIITKKDCLTIDISAHVLLLRSRNLIKMAYLFPSPSL
jgi:hypothetical protein